MNHLATHRSFLLFIFYALGAVFDDTTTYLCNSRGFIEANLFMNKVIEVYGFGSLIILDIIVISMFALGYALINKSGNRKAISIFTVVMVLATSVKIFCGLNNTALLLLINVR